MNKEVQEIDLLDLFLKAFVFIKNNLVSILIFGAIGALLGATYSFLRPEKYSQEIVGFSTIIEPEVIKESLSELASPDYREDLSGKTNDETLIGNINSIKNIEISDLNNPEKKVLKLSISSTLPIVSEELRDIIDFNLAGNKYILTTIENKKNRIEEIIIFLEKEIKLKQEALAAASNAKGTFLLNSEETPTSLYIKKKEYEEELSFLCPFVISKIGEPKPANRASLPLLLVLGGFFGCLSVIIFKAIKAIDSLSKELPEKRTNLFVYEKSA